MKLYRLASPYTVNNLLNSARPGLLADCFSINTLTISRSALRAANPKAARAATYRSFSLIWLQSTKNLEPISSAMLAESCRLSPNACPGKPALAPPEKPYVLFFEISPAEFLFSCKGCFWWFGYHFMAWVLIF